MPRNWLIIADFKSGLVFLMSGARLLGLEFVVIGSSYENDL